jgi:hypothetical protein
MNLKDWLLNMSSGVGLKIDMGFELKLEGGHVIHSIARIPSFGGVNGMLIVHSHEDVRPYSDEVIRSGFGYSVFDEGDGYDGDPEVAMAILTDWGWRGDPENKPAWAMAPVPDKIDGAKVILYAHVGSGHVPTGKVRNMVEGKAAGPVNALAICQYGNSNEYYLFGCDVDWRTITDTCHETIEAAKQQAEFEYEKISGAWIEA